MVRNRTSVGLDVHARSVVACGLDGQTGELFERRLTPGHGEIGVWVRSLPGPVAVAYEAGPTGVGPARFLAADGIECQVGAPSTVQRPSGDRIETDVRDARHRTRLLHLGEIVAVTVPSVEQEAARDLVRAREDVRGDLMSARHRLSTLVPRQGIVYYQGRPWTGVHDRRLRSHRVTLPGLRPAFDLAYDTVLTTVARRDRLDGAITTDGRRQRGHPGGDPAGVPARGLEVDLVRAGGGDRGRDPPDRPLDRRLPGVGAHRVLLGRIPVPGLDHQDRQRPRPPAADRGGVTSPPA